MAAAEQVPARSRRVATARRSAGVAPMVAAVALVATLAGIGCEGGSPDERRSIDDADRVAGERQSGSIAAAGGDGATHGRHYQCAMHPEVVSDEPGSCPICQMKLQLVDDDEGEPSKSRDHARAAADSGARGAETPSAEPRAAGGADPGPEKRRGFTLSTERQQQIGVKTARVERRPLAMTIRAAGRVAYDPKLYQAVAEYREAARAERELAASPSSEARTGAVGLRRAAALRLRQMGVSEEQARALAAPGGAEGLLLPGKSVWVYAQVYDADVPLIAPGQAVEVTSNAVPGRAFQARVASIDPIVDPMTRTTRVRVLVETPNGELRPESFVQTRITAALGDALAVPRDAVIDTGDEQVAFVVSDEGRFEPRRIVLGRDAEGVREVLSGLEEGEQVVVAANFLIDSESRFRAAAAQFRRRASGAGPGTGGEGSPRGDARGLDDASASDPDPESSAGGQPPGHIH